MAALVSCSLNRNVAVCCKIVLLLLFVYVCPVIHFLNLYGKTRLWIMGLFPSIFIFFIILTFFLLAMLSADSVHIYFFLSFYQDQN